MAFVNDLAGQALDRQETGGATGAPRSLWYRYDGREVGGLTNDGMSGSQSYAASIADRGRAPVAGPFQGGGVARADFDGGVSEITSMTGASGAGTVTVRAGDTLAGLAAQLWGDAGLWYKLGTLINPGVIWRKMIHCA